MEVIRSRLLKEMEDYWVGEVETQHPRLHLIVKLAGPKAAYSSHFERTAALHRVVQAQTTVPLAEVVAADESYQKWPWRYFIKTYLAGSEWAAVAKHTRAEALRVACSDLGAAAAELHQVQFSGFGELDQRAEVVDPLPYPKALARRAGRMIAAPQGRDFIGELIERETARFEDARAPALCHEDLHHYNLLLKKARGVWRLAGILDFEKAWAGKAEIDLARMELWGMTSEPFWQAYRARCPLDSGYARRKAIYQLIWCVEFAEETRQHLEDTRGLCRALGLPEIESFEPFRVKNK